MSFYHRPTYAFPVATSPPIEIKHVDGQTNVACVRMNEQDEGPADILSWALLLRPETRWASVRRDHPQDAHIHVQLTIDPAHTLEATLLETLQDIDTLWDGLYMKMKCSLKL